MNSAFPALEMPGVHLEPHGSAWVRDYRSGLPCEIHWKNGHLEQIKETDSLSCQDRESVLPWLAPSLLDLQVNGYGGIDFQREDHLDAEALLQAVHALHRDGCSRFFLTLITEDWPLLLKKLRRWKSLVDEHPTLKRHVVGWHLEGPFLSPQAGYVGAHSPEHLKSPSVGAIQEIKKITQSDPVLLTLAPEIPGSAEAIQEAVRLGMKISFGHTNAEMESLHQGVLAGGEGFTHLGNACPQTLDRHDNILWRVLDRGDLMTGVIPDGIHVSPALFRIIHRLQPSKKIWWTTDAMSAAGAGEGEFTLGRIKLNVGSDGIVRHPSTGGFAGSSLTPIEGIFRGANMLGISWREAWKYFSSHPAIWMNLEPQSLQGQPFAILREPLP